MDRIKSSESTSRESVAMIRELADTLANQARVISHLLEGVR